MIHEILPVGALQCNCSILGDEVSGEAIVVDPGDNIPRILALLERHHLTVKQILITHAHIDHIAGAARLKQLTGAPILYNPRDLPLVKMMDMQAGWLGIATPEVPPPDDTLEDGRIIAIGSTTSRDNPAPSGAPTSHPRSAFPGVAAGFSPRNLPPEREGALAPAVPITGQILFTPGHTQGSVCLHLSAQNLLLAGDTLFAGSVGRTDLPGGNTSQLLRSIHDKLLPLPDETVVIPGHGPATTIGEERESNPFLS